MKHVRFIGCDEQQHNYGGNTGDFEQLTVGVEYTVDKEEVHSWHTKLYLEGFEGSFNSVCFEEDV